MQRAGRWAGLSNPFAKVLAARPGSGKRSSGAESSASSGGGAGAELGKAFLGSCLKESKRDCRSVQLSAFYTIVTSRLHSLPFGKLQITTNLAPKRRGKKKKERESERESKSPSPFSPSRSSHPPFLSSSLALPLFPCGSRSSLGLGLSPTGLSNFLVISQPLFYFLHPLP